jgi:hypothetical protein
MIPFTLCSACLAIVLEQSEKAREIFNEIIEYFSLPGCQETMDKIGEELPDNISIFEFPVSIIRLPRLPTHP